MDIKRDSAFTRRKVLMTGSAAVVSAALPKIATASKDANVRMMVSLRAAAGQVKLDPSFSKTASMWRFNDKLPGPEIRVKQGEILRVTVDNALTEDTTVHWHGVRIPNAMDGVPYLTQKPISPGEKFTYEFAAVDAGTFWYHPHVRSHEQVGRGLYGSLIVEEKEPLKVDRDVTWILDDWRLNKNGEIHDSFGNAHDMSHGGRIGNVVTINGKSMEGFPVQKGERIRLRLINVANARIFALDFQDHTPTIIAMDGQPVDPHQPDNGLVVLGPAMRVDLILDIQGKLGSEHVVMDRFYKGLNFPLTRLKYAQSKLRDHVPDWSLHLPKNPLAEPDLQDVEHHEVLFNGGMMGGMIMREMGLKIANSPSMMGMMHSKKIWLINGVAAEGPIMKPMLNLKLGRSHVITMINATAWFHPIHLHGHSFRVLSRNGKRTRYQEWQDTVLMAPRERVEIAFVADNPGDWMFHCHILEHAASGMMGVIRVA